MYLPLPFPSCTAVCSVLLSRSPHCLHCGRAVLCAFGVFLAFWRSASWLLPDVCWRFGVFRSSGVCLCGLSLWRRSGVLEFWRWGVLFFLFFLYLLLGVFWGFLSAAFGVWRSGVLEFLFLVSVFGGCWGFVFGVLAFWRSGVFTCVLGVCPRGFVPIW